MRVAESAVDAGTGLEVQAGDVRFVVPPGVARRVSPSAANIPPVPGAPRWLLGVTGGDEVLAVVDPEAALDPGVAPRPRPLSIRVDSPAGRFSVAADRVRRGARGGPGPDPAWEALVGVVGGAREDAGEQR